MLSAPNNLLTSLPDSFNSTVDVTYIDLSLNYLAGDLPQSLGNLANLQCVHRCCPCRCAQPLFVIMLVCVCERAGRS